MKQLKIDLKEGLSKDQALKNCMERDSQNRNKAISYLASIPDITNAQKYSFANNILIGIYSIVDLSIILMKLITAGFSFIVIDLIVYIFITYFLFKKKAFAYIFLGTLMVYYSRAVLVPYLKEPTTIGLLFLLTYVFILIYALVLKMKLFPNQNLFNLKKDKKGTLIFNHTNI